MNRKQKLTLTLDYLHGITAESCGVKYGVSTPRAYQIVVAILKELRLFWALKTIQPHRARLAVEVGLYVQRLEGRVNRKGIDTPEGMIKHLNAEFEEGIRRWD